jgi:hypothetical protein
MYLVIAAALIVIFVFGRRLVWIERVRTYQSMPIPYSLVTLGLVLPAISMAFSTILKIRRGILDFNKKE